MMVDLAYFYYNINLEGFQEAFANMNKIQYLIMFITGVQPVSGKLWRADSIKGQWINH
jgi:hypothetical protein